MPTHPGSSDAASPRPFPDLTGLLSPRSVAVIGASDTPGNIGAVPVRLMSHFGYVGDVWPINPNRASVAGLRCYPTIADTPRPADLVILAVQARHIPDLVRECAANGIRHGVALSGGFADVGGAGMTLQHELTRACLETGFLLVGPNSAGLIDSHRSMIASFASILLQMDSLQPGNISMVGQSGGLVSRAHGIALQAGFGFRFAISSGNEAVLTTADYINALVEDRETKVIATYLEGVRDGDRLMAALTNATRARKPVVILKGGYSPVAAAAAFAHTGALVGEERVWRAMLDELGAIQVDSLEELADVALYLSSADLTKLPAGQGVAIVTSAGGSGVIAADQVVRAGLTVPPLAPSTRDTLRPMVAPIASTVNPIDLTPETYREADSLARFPDTLMVVASDAGVHSVLALFGAMGRGALQYVNAVAELRARTDRAVCLVWALVPPEVREAIRASGLYAFEESARAIGVLAKVASYRARAEAMTSARPALAEPGSLDKNQARQAWASVHQPDVGGFLPEPDCHRLLEAAGLPSPAGEFVTRAAELSAAVSRVGLPVVLKGIAAGVSHREAAGLLALGLATDEQAHAALREITSRAGAQQLDLAGIYVQHMVVGGHELLLSSFRDASFGVVVSVGAGGTLTELIDDVALASAPLDAAGAKALLRRLKVIQNAIENDRADGLDELATFVARFSALTSVAPWKRFVLEVNPVSWSADTVTALDCLLALDED